MEKLFSMGLQELADQLTDESLRIEIPDPEVIDLGPDRLASLVARTSNAYGRIARLAGITRAEAKMARGRYERKYKQSRNDGRNDYERESNAMEACAWEHEMAIEAEAIATVAEALEAGARIASESARKLYGQQDPMATASRRERFGSYAEDDFRP